MGIGIVLEELFKLGQLFKVFVLFLMGIVLHSQDIKFLGKFVEFFEQAIFKQRMGVLLGIVILYKVQHPFDEKFDNVLVGQLYGLGQ